MKTAPFALLLLLLAACARPTTATQPPPAADKLSLAATGRALGTLAPSLTPALSSTPTFTPLPSLTPTQTQPPESDYLATAEAALTAGFQIECEMVTVSRWVMRSPDGNWLAFECDGPQRDLHQRDLRVRHKDGRQWLLPFAEAFKGELSDYDFYSGGVYPLHWSADNTYLYYAVRLILHSDATCYYPNPYQALYRLNVNTGDIVTVLPPASSPDKMYEIEFAPQGELMAYSVGMPVIFNLISGDYVPVRGLQGNAGGLEFSPNGTQLAFYTCIPSADSSAKEKYNIQVYTLDTGVSEIIYESVGRMSGLVRPSESGFEIMDYSSEASKMIHLYYEWETGKLYDLMTTPKPTP